MSSLINEESEAQQFLQAAKRNIRQANSSSYIFTA
jgi:hypothetical protein